MRTAVILVIAMLLAGCEHMYGGVDRSVAAFSTPTEADVIAIATKALEHRHFSPTGFVPSVADAGEAWRVRFAPNDGALDGGVTVEISKRSRRVLRHWFDA